MRADDLKALQAPIKERYLTDPDAALVTLSAAGNLGEGVSCSVQTGRAISEAGLHPATLRRPSSPRAVPFSEALERSLALGLRNAYQQAATASDARR